MCRPEGHITSMRIAPAAASQSSRIRSAIFPSARSGAYIGRQIGGRAERRMSHYIALIHKDPASCYGVSFPDVAGVITAGDTLDEAIDQAGEVLAFAAEDWETLTGSAFPAPRTLDALRSDAAFIESAKDAVVAAIPFSGPLRRAA